MGKKRASIVHWSHDHWATQSGSLRIPRASITGHIGRDSFIATIRMGCRDLEEREFPYTREGSRNAEAWCEERLRLAAVKLLGLDDPTAGT
jgi:hypothetical protein